MSGLALPPWAVRAWNLFSLVALAGAGLALAFFSGVEAAEGLPGGPRELPCAEWLTTRRPRWVALTGCRLDLRGASARHWKAGPAAATFRPLELYLPVAGGETPEAAPRVVLATHDAALPTLVEGLAATPVEGVDAYVEAHRDAFLAALAPTRLEGLLDEVPSLAARQALAAAGAPGAAVLRHHERPRVANAVFGVVLGLGLVAAAGWRGSRLRRG